MSEKGKKNANVIAIVVTWVGVIGSLATMLLSKVADAGLEVPAAIGSALAVLALLGRWASRVNLNTPRPMEAALAALLAIVSAAAVAPPDTFPGSVMDDASTHQVEDVIEPARDVLPVDDPAAEIPDQTGVTDPAGEIPLALYPAIGARLALAMFIPVACNPVTPGIKVAADKVTDGYTGYVRTDPLLSDQQKAERHELACNLRRLVGISVPADCPPVGGEE